LEKLDNIPLIESESPGVEGNDARVSPSRIRLEASTHCQLKCPTCETATGELYEQVALGFLRFDNFRQLIDNNPQVREIELSNFGEIFLNPHLPKIIEYAFQKNVQLSDEWGKPEHSAGYDPRGIGTTRSNTTRSFRC